MEQETVPSIEVTQENEIENAENESNKLEEEDAPAGSEVETKEQNDAAESEQAAPEERGDVIEEQFAAPVQEDLAKDVPAAEPVRAAEQEVKAIQKGETRDDKSFGDKVDDMVKTVITKTYEIPAQFQRKVRQTIVERVFSKNTAKAINNFWDKVDNTIGNAAKKLAIKATNYVTSRPQKSW